jgi:hypothetical protein
VTRRTARSQVRPLRRSTTTGRTRRLDNLSAAQYARRYVERMLAIVAIVTPLVVVLVAQLVPSRDGRAGDELIAVAMAASDVSPGEVSPAVRAYVVPLVELEAQTSPTDSSRTIAPAAPVAIRPVLWYQVAATDHGVSPYLLEALHQIETSAAPDGCWQNIEGSGAVGPFQFKQATFAAYGVDGNNDGVVDICGFADSLVSAANYLQVLGADESVDSRATRRALERYGTDPDRVIDLTRYYRLRAGPPTVALR